MQILEAFRALNALNEDVFDLDANGLQGLSDFKQNDDLEDDISIIDPEAENEDDLQDNYIGKVILDCCTCHSKLYKAKEEVTVDEAGELANVGEECPYCFTPDGFKVIGEVTEFDATKENSGSEEEEAPVNELLDANVTLDARGFGGTGNAVSVLGGKLPESLSTKNGAADGASSWDKMVNKASRKPASKDGYKSSRTVISDPEYRKNLNMKLGLPPKAFEEDITSDDDSVNEGIFGIKTKKEKEAARKRQAEIDAYNKEQEDNARMAQEWRDWCAQSQKNGEERERRERAEREARAASRRSSSSSRSSSSPSNTGKAGVYYSGGDYYSESLQEDIQDLSMTANDTHLEVTEEENGKVTVSMEPVTANGGETIEPISPETEAELMGGEEMPMDDEMPMEDEIPTEGDEAPQDEEIDVPIDEVDEDTFDESLNSYFRRVYENVESYKTTAIKSRGNSMMVEGKIKFASGKTKNTSFLFEAKDATRSGKVRFVGDNKQLTEGKKAFVMTGRVADKKLVVESMSYNYSHKDADGKSSMVRGASRVRSKRV